MYVQYTVEVHSDLCILNSSQLVIPLICWGHVLCCCAQLYICYTMLLHFFKKLLYMCMLTLCSL